MNLILFTEDELKRPLPKDDRRAKHLLEILKLNLFDIFRAGILNSVQGKGWIKKIEPHHLVLDFEWEESVNPQTETLPITLVCGLTRPQIVKRILRDGTSLGVEKMIFFQSQLGEKSYAKSHLWTKNEYMDHVIQGAEQSYSSFLPQILVTYSLEKALSLVNSEEVIVLERSDHSSSLSEIDFKTSSVSLVFGAERGWSDKELDFLNSQNYPMAHLGSRILRTEVAVIGGVLITSQKFKR